jgi:hypothetical protein
MNNIFKGILIISVMALILIGVFAFLIHTDPEKQERAMFTMVFNEFKPMAKELHKAFYNDEILPTSQRSVVRKLRDKSGEATSVKLNIVVLADKISIEWMDKANTATSVEFEPIIKINKKTNEKTVKWLCSGGSMLLRYRSKPCRTLAGLSYDDL